MLRVARKTRSSANADNGLDAFVGQSRSTNILGPFQVKQARAAEMAVRYAALSASRKVHVCHCNSLGGAT